MTARIPSASAIAQACKGPAPPNATSTSSVGSTPRSTVTTRTARSMAAATSRTDGVHVERREADRESGDDALRGRFGYATAHEADVGARPTHVEADRVGEATRGRDLRRGVHAAGGTREQQRRRRPRATGD